MQASCGREISSSSQLGIGFFTGMVVAMASRVTLGHSGRALEADDLTWYVLLGINIATLLRIVAEFSSGSVAGTLNVLAALLLAPYSTERSQFIWARFYFCVLVRYWINRHYLAGW